MKKTYSKILATAIVLMISAVASADSFMVDGLYYNTLSSTTGEITLWTGTAVCDGYTNQPSILSDGGTELKEVGAQCGDTLVLHFNNPQGWFQVAVCEGHWKKYANGDAEIYSIHMDNTLTDASGNKMVKIPLTWEVLDSAYVAGGWSGTFVLNGTNATFTRVGIIKKASDDPIYTVKGSSEYLFCVKWNDTDPDLKMKYVNGAWKWTRNNVYLPSGKIEYVVGVDRPRDTTYGNGTANNIIDVPSCGIYNVAIDFNPATKAASATIEKTSKLPGTLVWHGDLETRGWNAASNGMVGTKDTEMMDINPELGDQLWFYTDSEEKNWEFKIMEGDNDWSKYLDYFGDKAYSDENGNPMNNQIVTDGICKLTINQLLLDKINTIKENKSGWGYSFLMLGSDKCHCYDIVFVKKNEGETTLWTGNAVCKYTDQETVLSDGGFELINVGAQSGDTVVFHLTPSAYWASCELHEGHWKSYSYGNGSFIFPINLTNVTKDKDGNDIYKLPMTWEWLDSAFVANGYGGTFVLNGNNCTVTKIGFIRKATDDPIYTVKGDSEHLFYTKWNDTHRDHKMKYVNGAWEWTKNNVYLPAGTIEYVIGADRPRGTTYGNGTGNAVIKVPSDGIYNVTINFESSTKAVSATINKIGNLDGTLLWHGDAVTRGWSYAADAIMSEDGKELDDAGVEVGDQLLFYIDTEEKDWFVNLDKGDWSVTYDCYGTKECFDNEGNSHNNQIVTDNICKFTITQQLFDEISKTKQDLTGWAGMFTFNSNVSDMHCYDISLVKKSKVPTGIEEIENGKMEIENSAIYNLAGQRLNAAMKGINIINGKKYLK